ncbi:Sorting nexin mvp1 [Mucor circinelloides]
MQTPNDDILSPDYSNPLQYFSSQSLSRTTPPIYADDPWTTSSNASFDFNDTTNSSNYAVDSSFMMEPEMDHQDAGFGTELTANNVLLGADVPDAYFEIYSKSNPHHERVDTRSLQIIFHLAGISLFHQQKVMSLVVTPGENSVTRNEFNAYLALIACAQKNMDISLETVYHHRNDLPIPAISDMESFNIRDIPTTKKEPPVKKEDPWESDQLKQTDRSDVSSTNTAVQAETNDRQQRQAQLNRSIHQQEQEAMNQWFRDLDHISVSRTLEKEGFLFKHINYEVESEKLGCKVLRRFSDFWWLWEVLLRRYPYRIMPNLPPKKLGGRDDTFEERRRKGLVRFINSVARHPVLGKDEVVVAFLSHPSEINSWKRANPPSLDEEFVRKSHNIAYLERTIPMDLDDRIARMKKRLSVSIQQYERMCFIMNQMNRLKKALGTDYIRYSTTLNSVSELDENCWVPNCQGCPEVIRGYNSIAKSMQQAGAMLNKQAKATGDTIVESLKRQRDLFESFRELLERRERMSPIQNDTLSRQMARYKKGQIQPSVAHDEDGALQNDITVTPSRPSFDDATGGLSLVRQRDIFIKHCFMEELSYLHKQQASVSVMYNRFVRDEVKYSRQWSDHWKYLEVATSEMPNAPHDFL